MKVKDMIAKLQTFDPELPIAIADWNEQYSEPSEIVAETVLLSRAAKWVKEEREVGTIGRTILYPAVVIGPE